MSCLSYKDPHMYQVYMHPTLTHSKVCTSCDHRNGLPLVNSEGFDLIPGPPELAFPMYTFAPPSVRLNVWTSVYVWPNKGNIRNPRGQLSYHYHSRHARVPYSSGCLSELVVSKTKNLCWFLSDNSSVLLLVAVYGNIESVWRLQWI